MTPAHVINNLTSINLANLLRLMNCVSESLTTSLCSIFWIVKASARPFRILSFNSDLCGASKLYFYFVLICGSGVSHVPHGTSLRVTLFAATLWTWLVAIDTCVWTAQPLLSMWIALFSWTFCGLASDMLLVFGWSSWEKIIWKSNTISGIRNTVQFNTTESRVRLEANEMHRVEAHQKAVVRDSL